MARKPKRKVEDLYHQDSPFTLNTYPADTDQDQVALAALIERWAADCDQRKWPRALQAFQNHAFLVGQPFLTFRFNNTVLSVTNARPPSFGGNVHMPKTVSNYMLDPYQANVSMLTENDPMPRVLPNSDLPEDEDAAELAEVVLNSMWEDPLNLPEKMRTVAGQLCLTGTVGVEVTYADGETPMLVPRLEEEEVEDAILGKVMVEKETGTDWEMRKELRIQTWDLFELNTDPYATDDPDTMSWLMHSKYVDKGWIKETFGGKKKKSENGRYFPENVEHLDSDGYSNSPLYWKDRVKDLIDTPNEVGSTVSTRTMNMNNSSQCIMRIVDCKPSKQFPRGRTLITAGGNLVYAGDSRAFTEKAPGRWTPTTIFRYWTLPGRFEGMALLSELVPQQRKINAIDYLVQLNRQNLSIGGFFLPRGTTIPDGFGLLPGQNITYKPAATGHKPERIPNQPLPGELINERLTFVSDIQQISGTKDILAGVAPRSNIRSSSMLDFLKKQALASKRAVFDGWERSIEKLSQNILIEVSTKLTNPDDPVAQRIASAARDHSGLEIQAFTGADLRDNTVVKIDVTSKLLSSPEAKQQKAQEFMQYIAGAAQVLPPVQVNKLARIMGLEEMDEGPSVHVRKIRRMVSLIKQGNLDAKGLVFPEVDNPKIAVEVINNEILRPSFWDLEGPIQNALWDLQETYKQIMAEQQAAQMELMMAQQQLAQTIQGVPPQQGGPKPQGKPAAPMMSGPKEEG